MKNCFCGSQLTYQQCCYPLIQHQVAAADAEALMRSRYSAYVLKDFPYILETYATKQRNTLNLAVLEESAQNTTWLSLHVLHHSSSSDRSTVEFKAYYRVEKAFYLMHEVSQFIVENKQWRYTQGDIQPGSGEIKPARNEQCLCDSGRKFKKCCALLKPVGN